MSQLAVRNFNITDKRLEQSESSGATVNILNTSLTKTAENVQVDIKPAQSCVTVSPSSKNLGNISRRSRAPLTLTITTKNCSRGWHQLWFTLTCGPNTKRTQTSEKASFYVYKD